MTTNYIARPELTAMRIEDFQVPFSATPDQKPTLVIPRVKSTSFSEDDEDEPATSPSSSTSQNESSQQQQQSQQRQQPQRQSGSSSDGQRPRGGRKVSKNDKKKNGNKVGTTTTPPVSQINAAAAKTKTQEGAVLGGKEYEDDDDDEDLADDEQHEQPSAAYAVPGNLSRPSMLQVRTTTNTGKPHTAGGMSTTTPSAISTAMMNQSEASLGTTISSLTCGSSFDDLSLNINNNMSMSSLSTTNSGMSSTHNKNSTDKKNPRRKKKKAAPSWLGRIMTRFEQQQSLLQQNSSSDEEDTDDDITKDSHEICRVKRDTITTSTKENQSSNMNNIPNNNKTSNGSMLPPTLEEQDNDEEDDSSPIPVAPKPQAIGNELSAVKKNIKDSTQTNVKEVQRRQLVNGKSKDDCNEDHSENQNSMDLEYINKAVPPIQTEKKNPLEDSSEDIMEEIRKLERRLSGQTSRTATTTAMSSVVTSMASNTRSSKSKGGGKTIEDPRRITGENSEGAAQVMPQQQRSSPHQENLNFDDDDEDERARSMYEIRHLSSSGTNHNSGRANPSGKQGSSSTASNKQERSTQKSLSNNSSSHNAAWSNSNSSLNRSNSSVFNRSNSSFNQSESSACSIMLEDLYGPESGAVEGQSSNSYNSSNQKSAQGSTNQESSQGFVSKDNQQSVNANNHSVKRSSSEERMPPEAGSSNAIGSRQHPRPNTLQPRPNSAGRIRRPAQRPSPEHSAGLNNPKSRSTSGQRSLRRSGSGGIPDDVEKKLGRSMGNLSYSSTSNRQQQPRRTTTPTSRQRRRNSTDYMRNSEHGLPSGRLTTRRASTGVGCDEKSCISTAMSAADNSVSSFRTSGLARTRSQGSSRRLQLGSSNRALDRGAANRGLSASSSHVSVASNNRSSRNLLAAMYAEDKAGEAECLTTTEKSEGLTTTGTHLSKSQGNERKAQAQDAEEDQWQEISPPRWMDEKEQVNENSKTKQVSSRRASTGFLGEHEYPTTKTTTATPSRPNVSRRASCSNLFSPEVLSPDSVFPSIKAVSKDECVFTEEFDDLFGSKDWKIKGEKKVAQGRNLSEDRPVQGDAMKIKSDSLGINVSDEKHDEGLITSKQNNHSRTEGSKVGQDQDSIPMAGSGEKSRSSDKALTTRCHGSAAGAKLRGNASSLETGNGSDCKVMAHAKSNVDSGRVVIQKEHDKNGTGVCAPDRVGETNSAEKNGIRRVPQRGLDRRGSAKNLRRAVSERRLDTTHSQSADHGDVSGVRQKPVRPNGRPRVVRPAPTDPQPCGQANPLDRRLQRHLSSKNIVAEVEEAKDSEKKLVETTSTQKLIQRRSSTGVLQSEPQSSININSTVEFEKTKKFAPNSVHTDSNAAWQRMDSGGTTTAASRQGEHKVDRPSSSTMNRRSDHLGAKQSSRNTRPAGGNITSRRRPEKQRSARTFTDTDESLWKSSSLLDMKKTCEVPHRPTLRRVDSDSELQMSPSKRRSASSPKVSLSMNGKGNQSKIIRDSAMDSTSSAVRDTQQLVRDTQQLIGDHKSNANEDVLTDARGGYSLDSHLEPPSSPSTLVSDEYSAYFEGRKEALLQLTLDGDAQTMHTRLVRPVSPTLMSPSGMSGITNTTNSEGSSNVFLVQQAPGHNLRDTLAKSAPSLRSAGQAAALYTARSPLPEDNDNEDALESPIKQKTAHSAGMSLRKTLSNHARSLRNIIVDADENTVNNEANDNDTCSACPMLNKPPARNFRQALASQTGSARKSLRNLVGR